MPCGVWMQAEHVASTGDASCRKKVAKGSLKFAQRFKVHDGWQAIVVESDY
jgi:hypothetical protein